MAKTKVRNPDNQAVIWEGDLATKEEPDRKLTLVSSTGRSYPDRLYFNGNKTNGVLKPLIDHSTKEPVSVYTKDWRELEFYSDYTSVNYRAGQTYPGGRPTELDYTAGMDTQNPPQKEEEGGQEEGGQEEGGQEEGGQEEGGQEEGGQEEGGQEEGGQEEPTPPAVFDVFTELDLVEFMGDEAPSMDTARAAVRMATDYVDNYTRGAAFRRVRYPRAGVNAVIATMAARIAANPGMISRRDTAGSFQRSLGKGFEGLTLTERQALDRYRRTAR